MNFFVIHSFPKIRYFMLSVKKLIEKKKVYLTRRDLKFHAQQNLCWSAGLLTRARDVQKAPLLLSFSKYEKNLVEFRLDTRMAKTMKVLTGLYEKFNLQRASVTDLYQRIKQKNLIKAQEKLPVY